MSTTHRRSPRDRADVDVPTLATLTEPTRRRIFDYLQRQRVPMTRNDVATALGVARATAAFHLDALAQAGVVEVDFARPPGKKGPGAGRPAKRYHVVITEIAASLPARRYDLAGQILAAGVRDASRSAGTVDARMATFSAAEAKGRELALGLVDDAQARPPQTPRDSAEGTDDLARVCSALCELGYEPTADGGDALTLRNCPFHAVVHVEPELVCEMNVHLLRGLLAGLSTKRMEAQFTPTAGECCVRIVNAAKS